MQEISASFNDAAYFFCLFDTTYGCIGHTINMVRINNKPNSLFFVHYSIEISPHLLRDVC